MPSIADIFTTLTGTLTGLQVGAASFGDLTDDTLTATHTIIAGLVRAAQKYEALSAAEIAHRSAKTLGQAGLSSRFGFVSPEAMVQNLGGGTRAGAGKLVSAGTMLIQAETADDLLTAAEAPWHAELGTAVAAGRFGAETAAGIRRGLGEPTEAITPDLLRATLTELLRLCDGLNADAAYRAARHTRDRIDATGIAARAEAMAGRQYWRQWAKPDGMIHGEYELDPENGAYFTDAYNQLLSPRLGGPRFVDASKKAWVDALVNDPRSTQAIAAEAFVELIKLGANADPNRIYGGNKPAVRIIVHKTALDTGHGSGAIEGCPEAISLEAVEHELCNGGFIPIEFDDTDTNTDTGANPDATPGSATAGQPLDVGREKRLFTWKQKTALAIRDGGCMWPDCNRPPSWTEAHHINDWHKRHGKTNIADGISLCRKHHMLLHNQHWNIHRTGAAEYWLTPPATIDPKQTPIHLKSKSILGLQSPVQLRSRQ